MIAIALSSNAAATRPVAIALRTTMTLQCGWPGPVLDVVFPKAERLPNAILRSHVLIDGKPPAALALSGRTVSLAVPRPQVLCDAIGPATVRVTFTRAAGLGNPIRPGGYAIALGHGAELARGSFRVR